MNVENLMTSTQDTPVTAKNALSQGPTTAELRRETNPFRPGWNGADSLSYQYGSKSAESDVLVSDLGYRPRASPLFDLLNEPSRDGRGDDVRSVNGEDIDQQTHQPFVMPPVASQERRLDVDSPARGLSPHNWRKGLLAGSRGSLEGARHTRLGLSRKKRCIALGALVALAGVGLAVGLGVYFGAVHPKNSKSSSSGNSSTQTMPQPTEQPTKLAGPLLPGAYNVTLRMQTNPCLSLLSYNCGDPLDFLWQFTSSNGSYTLIYPGPASTNISYLVGAADSSGVLNFTLPISVIFANSECPDKEEYSYSLKLSASSFTGDGNHTLVNQKNCNETGKYIAAGASCSCAYSVSGS